jgi:hypothetical protein
MNQAASNQAASSKAASSKAASNQDAIMRARVLLLGANRRVARGTEALWAYRLLTGVSPDVYGSKLAHVLVEASRSARVRDLPRARVALLEEAVTVARALGEDNPYRAKVLGRALDALRAERSGAAGEGS